jgi:regulator of protease activity HflC (stomatin/prohibitin superfamily)
MSSLIDFLLKFWEKLLPFWIVEEYNASVQLRYGKFLRELPAGFWWKIPFLDSVIEVSNTTTSTMLYSQAVTTKDGKHVVFQVMIKYKLSDVQIATLEVSDAVDGLIDTTMGISKRVIMDRTWQQCQSNDLDDLITKKARAEAKKWGYYLESATLVTLTEARSYRLFGDSRVVD